MNEKLLTRDEFREQDEEDTFYKRSFLIVKYIKFKVPESRYIAVDDRPDLYHSEFEHSLFTDPSVGLTMDDANKIVNHLNNSV